MSDTRVGARQTVRLGLVEGDLLVEDHARIQPLEGNLVVVKGEASFEGSVEIDCDFECSSLRSRDGMVRIDGGLTVHDDIDVDVALYVRKTASANSIDVGGKLSVGSLRAKSVDVGGSLDAQGELSAEVVDVGGSVEAAGALVAKSLDVGGRVAVGGGEVSELADVGGTFASSKPLKFAKIDVGGTVELEGGEGKIIDVGGRLVSKGDLTCDEIEAGGVIDVEGNLSGGSVEVGGRVRVSGDVALARELEVGGEAEISGVLSATDVEVGGRLRTAKGLVKGQAKIGGAVDAPHGLKAADIELGRHSRCTGTLVGGRVRLGRGSEVQDVYCSELDAGAGARMGKVFAERAILGDGCELEALLFTHELKQGAEVRCTTPPQKASALPPFPL